MPPPDLSLRPIGVDDAAEVFTALEHQAVGTYIGGPVAASAADFARVIERWIDGPPAERNELWLNFVVRLEGGEVVGYVQATVHATWAEVAWVIGTPWWGRGIGTASARHLIREVTERYRIDALWATIHPENLRSERLLRRLEFLETTLEAAPVLGSYDEGDRVFVYRAPAIEV